MGCTRLLHENIIDPLTEGHINFIKSLRYAIRTPHCHDFFELFVIIKGNVIHWANGERQLLSEGALVFLRPEDTHYYEQYMEEDCQLVNLAFPPDTAASLFGYLGEGFRKERLTLAESPPYVLLAPAERQKLISDLESLTLSPNLDKERMRIRFRVLLAEIFTSFFPPLKGSNAEINTDWTDSLYKAMQKKEHFTEGLPAMLRLSGKSQEHLCRVFRKRFNKSPTEFVNGIRLDYAANLLVHTDESILDISASSGFENLSHFYHLFKKCFKQPPADYRKSNGKIVIP